MLRTLVWLCAEFVVALAAASCTGMAPPATSVLLTPTLGVASAVPEKAAGLTHGPVVGAVTSHSARVLVRTNRSANIKLLYGKQPDLSDASSSATVTTDARDDFVVQLPLENLTPDTPYYLNAVVNDKPQLPSPYPGFKSFPVQGAARDFTFVVLNDFFWRPTGTFRNAAKDKPDFVIIGGDFSHNNPFSREKKRGMFKNRYNRSGPAADFVTFILDRFPVAHFWDDHDYGINNGDKTYQKKSLSLRILKEYFPAYPVAARGDWQSFSYANADFFLLDSRSQRDPDKTPDGPTKSMLDGDDLGASGQFAWLTNGLLASGATWKFILTPVPFNRTVPKPDAWSGYMTERKKLVDFIRGHGITGVVLIAGDLHAGGIDDGTNSDFPEMLVPSPNSNHCLTAPKPGTWSVGTYVRPTDEPCNGYGVVRVTAQPAQAQLLVKNDRGDTVLQLSVTPK